MSRPSYDEDPKLIEAVNDGMVRGLSYKESIAELKAAGIDINDKKLQRVRSHINRTNREKLQRIEKITLDSSVFSRIENHNDLMKHLWDIVKNPKEVWSKIAAIKLIYQYSKEHDEYVRQHHIYPRIVSKQSENEEVNVHPDTKNDE